MFKAGHIYKHATAKDLDILVLKVRYANEHKCKLLIKWISKTTGNVLILPGGRLDGADNITILAKDYQYWSA